ncbi:MAG: AMP-binding protein [Betaproteobacteria bacterium]|nr:AMP-binding protein [Betaproteobacteria bacterium]
MAELSPSNLFDVLDAAAERYGERELLIVGRRQEVATFLQLRDRADACGRVLAALGVRPGDRVAIWMTNRVDWAVAAYGAARCGAVTVGVNTRLSPREVAHLLLLTRPRIWIAEARFFGRGSACENIPAVLEAFAQRKVNAPEVLLLTDDEVRMPGTRDWSESLARNADAPALPPAAEMIARMAEGEYPSLAGAAVILSTSGTTAAPKGVVLGHSGIVRLARAVAQRQDLKPGQRFYSVGPFFHASGYMHALLTNLVAGSTLYTSRPYTAQEAWEILSGEAINAYHGSIVPLQEVARLPGFRKEKVGALTRAWYSAPATEMARLEGLYGTRMCEVYGLTETAGNVSICHVSDPLDMRHDSDGRPHDGVEVAIVDPQSGAPLPDGTPGEIRVRGFNVMLGYFRDPEATAAAVDAQGWLRTGDQGVKLPGGYVKFLSRIKDVIRVGGENLSPLEVEEVLMGHPEVQDAAVVAEPHPRLGEVPVAFLVLRPIHSTTAEALDAYCRERLANFKTPRRFIFVDDMPRSNAVNRVSKARLREMLAKGEV